MKKLSLKIPVVGVVDFNVAFVFFAIFFFFSGFYLLIMRSNFHFIIGTVYLFTNNNL
jgi:multisubunit Na+/H+ antiporter MnhC subunit